MNLSQELEQTIERMNEAELHALFSLVREKLKFFHQMHDLHSLQQFHLFDEVLFKHHGESIAGIVIRINTRSVTIKTTDRGEWKVSPVFVTKVRESSVAWESKDMSPSHHNNHSNKTSQTAVRELNPFAEVPRNAPCPCGSGKKFKKCHLVI
ncbi:MAG: hypothetical protein G01um101448_900 [Parcubacteria group bacterium Gr01-1014_48]|nr:MAG: hypothetical protein Greene041614_528 [Parcubacteria group bacterium Greene0416_14]TSC72915.1 MAG: hypothetical protein G01um101448_900 [Parcubacteria group bacterium Gr01-1014_48]TSD00543.1 MAG: hypothetical protein Greene101415_764 [Parcubacteria group bacterium Greene1014_15]TSD07767.1 MAG: hypothetical protein Greene07144_743 [Parcubacteria group bacterium Greene0714_4]